MPPISRNPQGLQLVDPVLTNLALAHRPDGFIYDQVCANMQVQLNHGQYPVWSREDLYRADVEAAVADRAETPEIDAGYSLKDYQLHDYRLKVSITPEERNQAHPALHLEQMKLYRLLDSMAIIRERRLAAKLRKTTNGGQLTLGGGVTNKWDAASGVTIEKDVKAARQAVYDATGQMADTIILPWTVANAVAIDPAIREIIKYTVDGQMILARGEKILPNTLWGLNVLVVAGKSNTARAGATEALADIWGDSVRLIKQGVDNAWGDPATVYCLRGQVGNRTQNPGGAGNGGSAGEPAGFALVDRWATPDPPVDYVRAWEKVEEKVVAADVGYEINDVLT